MCVASFHHAQRVDFHWSSDICLGRAASRAGGLAGKAETRLTSTRAGLPRVHSAVVRASKHDASMRDATHIPTLNFECQISISHNYACSHKQLALGEVHQRCREDLPKQLRRHHCNWNSGAGCEITSPYATRERMVRDKTGTAHMHHLLR